MYFVLFEAAYPEDQNQIAFPIYLISDLNIVKKTKEYRKDSVLKQIKNSLLVVTGFSDVSTGGYVVTGSSS